MRRRAPQELGGQTLEAQFGPLIGGQDLRRILGFRSRGAFRVASERGYLPVRVFALEGRRGKFALTADVEAWLAQLRAATQASPHDDRESQGG